MDRVTASWTPTVGESRRSVLAWWRCAPPRLRRRERRVARIVLSIGIVVLTVGVATGDSVLVVCSAAAIGFGILLAFDRCCAPLVARRLDRQPNSGDPIHLVADLSGVGWQRAAEEHRFSWTTVGGIHDAGDFTVLTFGDSGMMAIPRDALGPEGGDQLAQLWTAVNTIETLPPVTEP